MRRGLSPETCGFIAHVDIMSTNTEPTPLNKLKAQVEHLWSKLSKDADDAKIFIPKRHLDELSAEIDKIIETTQSIDEAQDADGLAGTVAEMRKKNNILEAQQADLKATVAKLRKMKADAESKSEAAVLAKAAVIDGLKAQKADLTNQLAAAKDAKNKALLATQSPSAKFSPDQALEAQQDVSAQKDKIRLLQAELESVNNVVKGLHDSVNTAMKDAKDIRQALTDTTLELNRYKTASAIANDPGLSSITADDVEIILDEGYIKQVMGDKGLKWMKEAAAQHATAVRERVYKMLNAARSQPKNPSYRGLAGLLQIAFDWLKDQANKAIDKQLKLAGWADTVLRDMAAGTVRTIAYYRKLLEDVIGEIKIAAKAAKEIPAKASKKYADKTSSTAYATLLWYYDEANAWRQVLALRAKRWASKTYDRVKSSASFVRSKTPSFSQLGGALGTGLETLATSVYVGAIHVYCFVGFTLKYAYWKAAGSYRHKTNKGKGKAKDNVPPPTYRKPFVSDEDADEYAPEVEDNEHIPLAMVDVDDIKAEIDILQTRIANSSNFDEILECRREIARLRILDNNRLD